MSMYMSCLLLDTVTSPLIGVRLMVYFCIPGDLASNITGTISKKSSPVIDRFLVKSVEPFLVTDNLVEAPLRAFAATAISSGNLFPK